jgi:hypothetical protein
MCIVTKTVIPLLIQKFIKFVAQNSIFRGGYMPEDGDVIVEYCPHCGRRTKFVYDARRHNYYCVVCGR